MTAFPSLSAWTVEVLIEDSDQGEFGADSSEGLCFVWILGDPRGKAGDSLPKHQRKNISDNGRLLRPN